MSAHVGPCKNFFRSFACLVARFVVRLRATLGMVGLYRAKWLVGNGL